MASSHPGHRPPHGGGHHLVGIPGDGAGAQGGLGRGVAHHHRHAEPLPHGRPPARPAPATPRCRRSAARRRRPGRGRGGPAPAPTGWDALGHGDPLVGDDPDGVGRPPGVGVITVVTPLAISSQVRVIDPTWAKGSGESRRSPGAESTSVPAATAARQAWSNTAPLGSPVVPLVHTTATGSVRRQLRPRRRGAARRRPRPPRARRAPSRSVPAGRGAVLDHGDRRPGALEDRPGLGRRPAGG